MEDLATAGGMRRIHNGKIDITWAVRTPGSVHIGSPQASR
jgi:hypothetical protein